MANEAPLAVRFVDAVLAECHRHPFAAVDLFAVVDLVSRDATRQVLEEAARPGLHVVWAPETRGVADAYVRGYREAIAAGADWILEIDAGFSHDPAEIGAFVAAMRDGVDCVFGSRFHGGRHGGALRRRALSRAGTLLANLLLGTRLHDMTGGYELFRRDALAAVLAAGIRSRGPFFQTEIRARCRSLRTAEVPIRYRGASHRIDLGQVAEALANLAWLARERLRGRL